MQKLVRGLFSPLVRALLPFGSTRRVIWGPARGKLFVVGPSMGFTFAIGIDAAAPRHLSRWIHPGMTVYDIGANRGQTALVLTGLVGPTGRVISFEPAPTQFALLKKNVEINGLTNVECLPLAVSDARGTVDFQFDEKFPTEGRLSAYKPDYNSPLGQKSAIQTISLDDLLADYPAPTVIKIDVEGAGGAVLRGARNLLDRFAPVVYMETHNRDEMRVLNEELIPRGYSFTTPAGEKVSDPSAKWVGPLWCSKDGRN